MAQVHGVELEDLELAGPRLRLRPWQAADAPDLVAALASPDVHRFIALPHPYTRADADRFITGIARPGRADGSALECAVAEAATGRLVGSAALRLVDDAEVGYWIAPAAQGNGYAAEAATVLADWAFSCGLARVRLACDVRNVASVRTALAAGYRYEGIARAAIVSPGGGSVPPRRGELARFARLPDDPVGPVPYAFPQLPAEGLSDGVLQLRVSREEDAPALAETDDELTLRWGFTGVAHTEAQARRESASGALQWLVGATAPFTMVDVATGLVAGSLRLRKAGPPQVGGIGYVVHPAFRGRGYTTRALRLLVPWAFEVADFARLELGAKEGNVASLRAAANAGFEPDGIRERRMRNPDGTFADEVRYAFINPKYR
jgi:RimJ/RimL family protein N-acetyltransferase